MWSRWNMVEFYSIEQLIMMMSTQMYRRYYLDRCLQKQDDDIELVSIDDVNDHNHQNIFEYHHTMNNYIVYHDWPNMMYNQRKYYKLNKKKIRYSKMCLTNVQVNNDKNWSLHDVAFSMLYKYHETVRQGQSNGL